MLNDGAVLEPVGGEGEGDRQDILRLHVGADAAFGLGLPDFGEHLPGHILPCFHAERVFEDLEPGEEFSDLGMVLEELEAAANRRLNKRDDVAIVLIQQLLLVGQITAIRLLFDCLPQPLFRAEVMMNQALRDATATGEFRRGAVWRVGYA